MPKFQIVLKSQAYQIAEYIKLYPHLFVVVNDVYADIFKQAARYQILYGGAAAGKSDAKATHLLLMALTQPFFRCLFVRKNSTEIRESQFSLFKDVIQRQNWHQYFDYSTAKTGSMEIICKLNGNRLIPHGLDDPHKLTSIHDITDVWLEEPLSKSKSSAGGHIGWDDFSELDRRIRTQKAPTHIHLTFNPIGTQNWIYSNFFDFSDKGKAAEYARYTYTKKSTFMDNAFIDREAEEIKFRRQGAYEYRVFALGEWGLLKAKNAWFYEYDQNKHVAPIAYNDAKPYILSIDFNLDKMATTIWQTDRDFSKIYCPYEFDVVQGLEQRIKSIRTSPFADGIKFCYVTGDATGNARNQINPNVTHYSYMKESLNLLSEQFKVGRSNLRHSESRLLTNAVIRNGDFCIDEKCINLQSDMQSTETDGEDGINKKLHDPHFGDGFRYVCQNFLFQYYTDLGR